MRRQRHRIRTAIRARKERLDEQQAAHERDERDQPSLAARVAGAVGHAAETLPELAKAGATRIKDEAIDVAQAAEAKVAELTGRQDSAEGA